MFEIYAYLYVCQRVTKKSVKVVKAKSRKLLYMRAYAREETICIENLMIWRECFRAKTKTPPPEVEELDRNSVDGSDVMIYLPSIARRIWRESSA